MQITCEGIHHYRFLQEQNFTKINKILQKLTKFYRNQQNFTKNDKIAPKENNVITIQRYFFVLEILDKQAFNNASFNPVLFLSVLRIQ